MNADMSTFPELAFALEIAGASQANAIDLVSAAIPGNNTGSPLFNCFKSPKSILATDSARGASAADRPAGHPTIMKAIARPTIKPIFIVFPFLLGTP